MTGIARRPGSVLSGDAAAMQPFGIRLTISVLPNVV